MVNAQLINGIPKEIRDLVAKGIYDLFWSSKKNEFAVVTRREKIFSLAANGSFISETNLAGFDLSTYEQIYTQGLEAAGQFRNSRP